MPQVNVYVTLKPSLLDAQGKVVQSSLHQIGYPDVAGVRIGKVIEMTVDSGPDLGRRIGEMCDKLLANPVIEDYRYEVLP